MEGFSVRLTLKMLRLAMFVVMIGLGVVQALTGPIALAVWISSCYAMREWCAADLRKHYPDGKFPV
jgi:hypothetical protein